MIGNDGGGGKEMVRSKQCQNCVILCIKLSGCKTWQKFRSITATLSASEFDRKAVHVIFLHINRALSSPILNTKYHDHRDEV